MPARRARGFAARCRCAATAIQVGADDHQHEALELRRGEARHDLVVAAHELDQEALQPRQQQVEREQHARPEAVAPVPQQPRDQPHRERLVHGRRVHLLVGGHRAVGIGHRPRQVGCAGRSRRRPRAGSRRGRSRSPAPAAAPRRRAAPATGSRATTPRRTRPARRRSRRRTRPGPSPRRCCRAGRRGRRTSAGRGSRRARRRGRRPARRRSSRTPSRRACRAPSKRRAITSARGEEAEREHEPEGLQLERADVDLGLHGADYRERTRRRSAAALRGSPSGRPGTR